MSGTNACKETMLQQLSHGCAPHTNEGIDRFLRSAAVVFSKPSWCANLQLLQGLINISRSYTHVHTVFFKHFLIPVRNYRSFSLYNVYNSIGVTSIAHKIPVSIGIQKNGLLQSQHGRRRRRGMHSSINTRFAAITINTTRGPYCNTLQQPIRSHIVKKHSHAEELLLGVREGNSSRCKQAIRKVINHRL